jgi:hypothetical protein
MATTIARQIKEDYPGCHLTWAISFKCKQVIENNPFVDQIWSVEHGPEEQTNAGVWHRTRAQAEAKLVAGEIDRAFFTQIVPDNLNNFDGTTRSTTFRNYPGRITVPVDPIMRLRDDEIARVTDFARRHDLGRYKHIVLFEAAPGSNQSPLSPDLARRVAARVIAARQDTAFVISSHLSFTSESPAIIDASVLSYRENAELSKYCTFLAGASSGITWLTTSSAAKRLPTIQFLRQSPRWYSFASVKYDHEHFGLDTKGILETTLEREDEIADAIQRYLAQGTFDGIRAHTFRPSLEQIYDQREMMGDVVDVRRVLANFKARNPSVPVSLPAFYAGWARRKARAKVRGAVRRLTASR